MTVQLRKVAIIGASSGIGESIALQLAREGADVAIVARRLPELERVAARVPGRIRVYEHDASHFDAVPSLFERVIRDLGGLDTLIYAAAVMPKIEEGEYSFAKDHAMLSVNALGAMAWMNLAAARFEAARAGTIVGISSIAGDRGRRSNPGYCASKAALTSYLEGLRNRCSRYGVNVVTMKPGFVDTAMTRGMKGLFWVASADEAARQTLALARRGSSATGFVRRRWSVVASVVRTMPSFVFRRLNL